MQLITHKTKQIVKARTKSSSSSSSRSNKAVALSEAVLESNTTGTYFVPSQTAGGKFYEVKQVRQSSGGGFVCNCADFEYRHQDDDTTCKHIGAVRIFSTMKGGAR